MARHTTAQALEAQAASCRAIGSELYATVLEGLLGDHRAGGITAGLLDGITDTPIHDALPLRYLATGHLLALTGAAPELAGYFPSCGGSWDGRTGVVAAFLRCVAANRDEFVVGLRRNVQTNEVGRAAVLASGFALIGERFGLALDQLELGSSAGLLSRWDHFGYDTGTTRAGDPASPVQFGPAWWANTPPDLSGVPTVDRRRACDIAPIDVTTARGRSIALSFIWPDQAERFGRLDAAISVAARVPVQIDAADAAAWLQAQIGQGLASGVTTVVFHSIVWQYLPLSTKDGIRTALAAAGATATPRNPLCWLRMEPATVDHADLRLTTWPGGTEERLAEVGYHGAGVRWLA